MRPRWRLIETAPLSGVMNMALDEVLLHAVQAGTSPPVVRLYRWQPAAISLGYAQRGDAQVNHDYCRARGIDIVRRLTGGRAVLHDQEITYAVISRQSGLFSANILENYRIIAEVFLDCLKAFGLEARLSGRHGGHAQAGAVEQSACFTAPAQFEIVCAGKKICGSSQKRMQESFLQHGSLPVNMDLDKLFCALNTEAEASHEAGVARLADKVGWINRFREDPVTIAEVASQLKNSFVALWPVEFSLDSPSEAEWEASRHLARSKYAFVDWHQQEVG